MGFSVAGHEITSINEVTSLVMDEIVDYLQTNKGVIEDVMSPIEESAVEYVTHLSSAIAHHNVLGQYWKELTDADLGFPSYYAPNPPLGSPNFGTFLQRGLFGLDKILSGVPENTSKPDMAIVDAEGNIMEDRKGIELKSSIATAEKKFSLTVGQITLGERAKTPEEIKSLQQLLLDVKTNNKVAFYRMLNKMQYFLWMRLLSSKESPDKRMHLKAMILFMRLRVKVFFDMLRETDASKPRITIEKSEIMKVRGKVIGGDRYEEFDIYKRKFELKIEIRKGEMREPGIKGVMLKEIEILNKLYAQRHDFVNELENMPGKAAAAFYREITGKLLRKYKFKNLD